MRVSSLLLLGGASEIGLAIAEAFANDLPARIVLAARPSERLDLAEQRLKSQGHAVETLAFDALDPSSHAEVIRSAFAGGEIDVAVIAFGVLAVGERAWTDADVAVELGQVNFVGAVSVGVQLVDWMREQGRGAIVVLSSSAVDRPRLTNFVYAATKAGMDAFFRGLAQSVRPYGIDVLVVRSGFVPTQMTRELPLPPRPSTPEQVADVVVDAVYNGRGPVVHHPPVAPARVSHRRLAHLGTAATATMVASSWLISAVMLGAADLISSAWESAAGIGMWPMARLRKHRSDGAEVADQPPAVPGSALGPPKITSMAEMSMNKAIHGAFRRDLNRFLRALEAFPDGDRDRAQRLGTAWDNFDDQLTRHHEGEHETVWPAIRAVGVPPETIAQMDEEHDRLARALASARDAMAALRRSASAADAAAARQAVAALQAVAVEHMDHEEAELEPVYLTKRDDPAIKAMGRQFARVSPPTAGTFFAWVADGATPDEMAGIKDNVPGPVLAIIGGIFGRRYRRTVAPVWR